MANVSRPNGFFPVKHTTGAPYNGQFTLYEVGAADGAALFVGDLVKASDEDSTTGYPTVERAGTSGAITSGLLIGSIVGFVVDPTNLTTPQYRAASTKRIVMVADAIDLIYAVEEDSVGGSIALASAGLNMGYVATAGSTTTGCSGMVADSSSVATTDSLPLRLVGWVSSPDNTAASANSRVLVQINQQQYVGGQTAV
jgi:hypothetical protein